MFPSSSTHCSTTISMNSTLRQSLRCKKSAARCKLPEYLRSSPSAMTSISEYGRPTKSWKYRFGFVGLPPWTALSVNISPVIRWEDLGYGRASILSKLHSTWTFTRYASLFVAPHSGVSSLASLMSVDLNGVSPMRMFSQVAVRAGGVCKSFVKYMV